MLYYDAGGQKPQLPSLGAVNQPSPYTSPSKPTGYGISQPSPYTSAGGGGASAALPNFQALDYSNDPILARIRALGEQQVKEAQAEALKSETQLAIGYGDPAFAKSLGLGKTTQQQAEGNTFGTVQELQRGYQRRNVFDIDRPLSDYANLFYSTERGRQRALSGEQLLRDQYNAQAAVQEKVAQIQAQEMQAKLAAQASIIQGEQDAYNRAIQQAMYAAGVSG